MTVGSDDSAKKPGGGIRVSRLSGSLHKADDHCASLDAQARKSPPAPPTGEVVSRKIQPSSGLNPRQKDNRALGSRSPISHSIYLPTREPGRCHWSPYATPLQCARGEAEID